MCHNAFIDLHRIDVAPADVPAIFVDGYDATFHEPSADNFLETDLGPWTIAFSQLLGIDTPEADVLIGGEAQRVTVHGQWTTADHSCGDD